MMVMSRRSDITSKTSDKECRVVKPEEDGDVEGKFASTSTVSVSLAARLIAFSSSIGLRLRILIVLGRKSSME